MVRRLLENGLRLLRRLSTVRQERSLELLEAQAHDVLTDILLKSNAVQCCSKIGEILERHRNDELDPIEALDRIHAVHKELLDANQKLCSFSKW